MSNGRDVLDGSEYSVSVYILDLEGNCIDMQTEVIKILDTSKVDAIMDELVSVTRTVLESAGSAADGVGSIRVSLYKHFKSTEIPVDTTHSSNVLN